MRKSIDIEPLKPVESLSNEFNILFGATEDEINEAIDEYSTNLISAIIYDNLVDFFGSPETVSIVLNEINPNQWKISE